eukprot:g61312.t1
MGQTLSKAQQDKTVSQLSDADETIAQRRMDLLAPFNLPAADWAPTLPFSLAEGPPEEDLGMMFMDDPRSYNNDVHEKANATSTDSDDATPTTTSASYRGITEGLVYAVTELAHGSKDSIANVLSEQLSLRWQALACQHIALQREALKHVSAQKERTSHADLANNLDGFPWGSFAPLPTKPKALLKQFNAVRPLGWSSDKQA